MAVNTTQAVNQILSRWKTNPSGSHTQPTDNKKNCSSGYSPIAYFAIS